MGRLGERVSPGFSGVCIAPGPCRRMPDAVFGWSTKGQRGSITGVVLKLLRIGYSVRAEVEHFDVGAHDQGAAERDLVVRGPELGQRLERPDPVQIGETAASDLEHLLRWCVVRAYARRADM